MVDSIYRTRSLGVAAEGLPDQYADGNAAKVWEYYIGHQTSRTDQYKEWIGGLLRKNKCSQVLDVACGTGTDSVMLLEDGFQMTSVDASDKMLKYALKKRWDRRKEPSFDQWVVEEANWLTLVDDMHAHVETSHEGYDAVICLGNSFAHLPDFEGDQSKHRRALCNFHDMIKPGGLLIIDHRNYDEILKCGIVPAKNIYYNSDVVTDIKCSNLYVNGQPTMVTLDYEMNISDAHIPQNLKTATKSSIAHRFRLSYYPHRLDDFTNLLKGVFGENTKQAIYGDFKPMGEIDQPAYYIHVVHKE